MSSRKGQQMAQRMADICLRESPSIAKAYGTREDLAEGFSVHGEFLAAVAQEKRAVIKANDRLLKRYQQQHEMSEKALVMFQRAQSADEISLSRMETYAGPDEDTISQRVAGMISRRMAVDATPFVLSRIDETLSLSGA
jgi:hypothetical protein